MAERESPQTRREPVLQFSILYDQLGFDQLGKPILVGPYSQIRTTRPPPFNFLFLISNQWTNGLGSHEQQTTIIDPDDRRYPSEPVQFHLANALAAHRVDHRFGITVQAEGRYRVEVTLNGHKVIEYFFAVRSSPPEQTGTDQYQPPS